MAYPSLPDFAKFKNDFALYTQLQHEYGAPGLEALLARLEGALATTLDELKSLAPDPELARIEPNDLPGILALRPDGPRELWHTFPEGRYRDRLAGALLGRCAGCTLGAPVEFWPIERMVQLAEQNGDTFPPRDYWSQVPDPDTKRYQMSPRRAYTRNAIAGVPVDDDIAYTLLGLLVVEAYGMDFTTEENATAWLRYLPYACTAERVALESLRNGVAPAEAGARDNPYCEWIGADIRADPWGYLAPGRPERAASMAYRDAYLSHRRQGIYGEMFFAAAIAAAFAVDDPLSAIRIGLSEIPRDCALAKAVRWALEIAPDIPDYRAARAAMDSQFAGMNGVHTINNACLTIWGLAIGGTDFTRVVGETVAMGMDNDCTAATAGSIVGAVIGKESLPPHWYAGFDDTVHSYLTGQPSFAISDLLDRFTRQAEADLL